MWCSRFEASTLRLAAQTLQTLRAFLVSKLVNLTPLAMSHILLVCWSRYLKQLHRNPVQTKVRTFYIQYYTIFHATWIASRQIESKRMKKTVLLLE